MNVLEDVCPISEFREHAASMVARVRSNQRPIIITQHGKSSAVLVSAESYQELLDRLEILQANNESEEEFANGGGIEQNEYRKALKAKFFP
ncbi:MAG TPA: type II toxin-antitoxin system Phd/YefM family antitoxin [Fibrobacteria bacterium]|nr:type II toxin-antitoxin system Phd/YefM family antitoxin [Fibrobacteria bacterium]